MTTETSNKGRPKVDWQDRAKHAHNYALLGASDAQITQLLGIAESALENAKRERPGFANAIKSGRIIADAEVAESLYRRCTGYQETETTTREIRSASGELLSVEIVSISREVPPDTDACIFWLSNRQSDKWRNKSEIEFVDKAGNEEPERKVFG